MKRTIWVTALVVTAAVACAVVLMVMRPFSKAVPTAAAEAICRFDFYGDNEGAFAKQLTFTVDELPDVTFVVEGDTLYAEEYGVRRYLYSGMPLWNVYTCDVNGDGIPELCSTVSEGSGLVDDHVVVFDYTDFTMWEFKDRGNVDYRLLYEDGGLYIAERPYNENEPYQKAAPLEDCQGESFAHLHYGIDKDSYLDAVAFDIDGDGQNEQCVLDYGAGRNIFSMSICKDGEITHFGEFYILPSTVGFVERDGALKVRVHRAPVLEEMITLLCDITLSDDGDVALTVNGVPFNMSLFGNQVLTSAAFPGTVFRVQDNTVYVEENGVTTPLFDGVYGGVELVDVTGDGIPELCSSFISGSGALRAYAAVYDHVQQKRYEVRVDEDGIYSLFKENGKLYARKMSWQGQFDSEAVLVTPDMLIPMEV